MFTVQNLFDRGFGALFAPQLRRLPTLVRRYLDELLAMSGVAHRKTRRIACNVVLRCLFSDAIVGVDKAAFDLLAPLVNGRRWEELLSLLRRCSVACLFETRPVIVRAATFFFQFEIARLNLLVSLWSVLRKR